jgi:hypothetical protein
MRRILPIALGLILVLSTAPPAEAASTRIRNVIRTSQWNTPSPDPTGLDFLPSGQLLVTDSEVDETPLSRNKNLWRIRRGGRVERTMSTFRFSHEPTDVAVDGAKKIWYFTDDTASNGRVFVRLLMDDGTYGTGDDRGRTFRTDTAAFSPPSNDPEGLAFGGGSLWLSDGTNGHVYRINPGPNGKIEGSGDDVITPINLTGLGINDIEGVEYAPNGNIFVLGNEPNADILEIDPSDGSLVQAFDVSTARLRNPSAIAFGPSSTDRTKKSFYIADRGVDNNTNPNENDGRIIELGIAATPPNLIRNGSFEVDRNGDSRPDFWTVNSHFVRSRQARHVGTYSGRHRAAVESSYSVRQDLADVVGGETYHFVGWTKILPTSNPFTYRLRIVWFGGSGARIGQSQVDVFTSSTTWARTERNVTAPAGTVRGKMVMSVTGLTGTIFADGFELTVVS